MRAGTNRDAGTIHDGGEVVRMPALYVEGHNRALVLGGTDDAHRIDLAQPPLRIVQQGVLVGADARFADRVDVVDRGTEPDRLDNRGSSSLEPMRWLAISNAVARNFADHLAATVERRHDGEMLMLSVQRPYSTRAIKLVTGDDVEVATNITHVDIDMDRRLRAI